MGRVDFFAKKDQHSDFEISLQKVTKSVIFKNSAKSPERAVLRLISVNGHRPRRRRDALISVPWGEFLAVAPPRRPSTDQKAGTSRPWSFCPS